MIRSIPMASLAAALLCSTAANAADPACAPVFAALMKTRETPVHQFQDSSGGIAAGQHKLSELVRTRDATYLLVNGKWRRSPLTPAKSLEMEQENIKERSAGATCSRVRDEAVEGESATLYATLNKSEDGDSSADVWISKRSGLVVKQVMRIDVGAGVAGKSVISIRFVHDNVHAPAGVQ
jgi:hypothetical protein